MSGMEVVAAVAAVVSAFHGGAELLKHIKTKRRQARQARQEFEEDQLQVSLETGEKQITHHYDQDMRQYGDLMRVGDVVAHERLQHITILMQGEVIKSLQLAAQYENAVLNLTLLHEASIVNRKDTIVTLDQLKQRLLIRMPISQLEGPSHSTSSFFAPSRPHRASVSNSTSDMPPSYVAVATTTSRDRYTSGPDDWSRAASTGQAAMHSRLPIAPAHTEYSQAYQRAMDARGITDPRVMHEEIDEIMESYQGLQISGGSNSPWHHTQQGAGRAAQSMPNTRFPPSPDPSSSIRDYTPIPNNLPPTPEELGSREHVRRPTFNIGTFGQQQQQQQQHEQKSRSQQPGNPHIQNQTHVPQFRWSNDSDSSAYSDPQSLNRHSSTSSQDSHPPISPPPRSHLRNVYTPSSSDSYQYHDGLHPVLPSNVPAERSTPLSPQNTRGHYGSPSPTDPASASPHSLIYSPFATSSSQPQPQPHSVGASFASSHQQYSIAAPDHDPHSDMQNRHQYHLWPAVARVPPGTQSSSSDHTVQNGSAVSSPVNNTASDHTVLNGFAPAPGKQLEYTKDGFSANAAVSLHRASVAPSVASTDSNVSTPLGILPGSIRNSIRNDTVRSNTDSAKMMNGRACKANNYWGFCKGAWTIREDQKKGLSVRVQPSGMYNTREVWECCGCSFKGPTFSVANPTKKGKNITIVDPRIHTSASGVRYKWIFLAKSHVKKKSTDTSPESNYGCIICSLEDKVSSVYGGVETLMNHIALSHVASLSETTRRKAKCIIGRTAGPNEHDWDINIPVFAQVEELP